MRSVSISIFVLIASSAAQAVEELPRRSDFSRYDTMLQRSPFAVASAVVAPAETPNFAKDLYVANAGHSPDGDMVTIASTSDKNFKKYLTTRSPVDGYGIASIEWSEKVGATKVTISKDGQFATIGFNEALLAQQAPGPQPQPQQPQPQPGRPIPTPGRAVPVPNPATPPPAATPRPARTPHVRGTINRYPTPPNRPPTARTPRPGS